MTAPRERRSSKAGPLDAAVVVALLLLATVPVLPDLSGSIVAGGDTTAEERVARTDVGAGAWLQRWDPYQFSGRPRRADPGAHAGYPPHLLLSGLMRGRSTPVAFVLHVWLGGIGAYLVCRHLALDRLAALAGGAAYVLSGTAGVALAQVQSIYVIAWLPWIVAFAMRSTDRGGILPHPVLVVASILGILSSETGWLYVLAAAGGWFLFAASWPSTLAVGRLHRQLMVQFALLACLSTGLTAFETVPEAGFRIAAGRHGGLVRIDPDRPLAAGTTADSDTLVRLRVEADARRGGRFLALCEDAVDTAQLVAIGVPMVNGVEGELLADYARFIGLAAGEPADEPTSDAVFRRLGRRPLRDDLLRLLDVEYLVSCEPPDEAAWTRVSQVGTGWLYRAHNPPRRAVWTCAPRAVGRHELESLISGGTYDSLLTLRQSGPIIKIRWAPHVEDAERGQLEAALHVNPQQSEGDRTWRYELRETSSEAVAAIVAHPAVEDTSGIDRASLVLLPTGRPDFAGEPKSEWLVGAAPCPDTESASVQASDRPDGGVVVRVEAPREGLVLLSEVFYPERSAWVDGHRVQPLKVNLAFMGVPVPAGIHLVELGYDNRFLVLGSGLTALTFTVWVVLARRRA